MSALSAMGRMTLMLASFCLAGRADGSRSSPSSESKVLCTIVSRELSSPSEVLVCRQRMWMVGSGEKRMLSEIAHSGRRIVSFISLALGGPDPALPTLQGKRSRTKVEFVQVQMSKAAVAQYLMHSPEISPDVPDQLFQPSSLVSLPASGWFFASQVRHYPL